VQFPEKHRKSFAIFAIGFFAIASQALLFREFLGSFESNDIAVGVFFSSWFFWIAISSSLVLFFRDFSTKIAAKTHLVILLYAPAFLLQYAIMLDIRSLAGVEAYEIFPIWKLIAWAVIASSPVSFITGAVFPLACRWSAESSRHPVAGTFIFESLGSFAGGAGTTLLLYAGMPVEYLSLMLCLVIVVACSLFLRKIPALCLLAAGAGLVISAVLSNIGDNVRIRKWTRLLPAESYRGSFTTPQAEYLYGLYKGQWSIVREGGAGESVPDRESALKIISIHLCQKPDAKKILVIGQGLNICRELLRFPQISEVAWVHYDGDYVRRVNSVLPAEMRISDLRFRPVSGIDAREFLKAGGNAYDIIIVNMPDATSSVVNRYFTVEFYEAAAGALAQDGIVGACFSSGENVIGPELALSGASIKNSLGYVFKNLVIVPGDSSWFIASDSQGITGEPDMLVKRLAGVRGVSKLYQPESLRSLYIPGRAEFALQSFASAPGGASAMINTDSMPLGFLYALLLSSRQSGMDVTGICVKIIGKGMGILLVPLLVFFCLALLSAVAESSGRPANPGAVRIIFCAGFVSIGTVIVLMYLFQTLLGTLYVNAGLVSALFMLGLAAGGTIAVLPWALERFSSGMMLLAALTLHVVLLFAISYQEPGFWSFSWFAMAFLFSGICCGTYFPIAARMLKESKKGEIESGGSLEAADHVGACLGAISCGILIVPFYGTSGALIFFMMLLALNIPLCSARTLLGTASDEVSSGMLILRHGAYIFFGAGAFLAISARLIFGMGTSLYIMFVALALFAFLALRKGRGSRPLMFAVAFALAVTSAVEFYSLVRMKDSSLAPSGPRPPPVLVEQSAPAAAVKGETKGAPESELPATGVPRDVDMPRLKGMIKSGRLSGKEADFYDKMDAN